MDFTNPTCPDCGAEIGECHQEGCDIEKCTSCKCQRIMCDCEDHDPDEAIWTGEHPGVAEAREKGWWAVLISGRGWQPCSAGTPGAIPDLNRLTAFEQTGEDCLYGPPPVHVRNFDEGSPDLN